MNQEVIDILKAAFPNADQATINSLAQKLTPADVANIAATGEVPANVAKDIEQIGATTQSVVGALQSIMTPEYIAKYTAELEQADREGRLMQGVSDALNLVARGAEMSAAAEQIKAGRAEAASLTQPTPPRIPAPSKALAEAEDIARARMASPMSPAERTALDSQNQLNRYRYLQAARMASGGQGSQLQAFNQVGALDASQAANAQLGTILASQRQAEGNFADIASRRAAEAQSLANMQNQQYQTTLDQYNNRLASARATESMGRYNRLQALNNLASSAPALGRAYTGLGMDIDTIYNNFRNTLAKQRNDRYMQEAAKNSLFYQNPYLGQTIV